MPLHSSLADRVRPCQDKGDGRKGRREKGREGEEREKGRGEDGGQEGRGGERKEEGKGKGTGRGKGKKKLISLMLQAPLHKQTPSSWQGNSGPPTQRKCQGDGVMKDSLKENR